MAITEENFQKSLDRVAKGVSSIVDVEIIADYVAQLNAKLICLRAMVGAKGKTGGKDHATQSNAAKRKKDS